MKAVSGAGKMYFRISHNGAGVPADLVRRGFCPLDNIPYRIESARQDLLAEIVHPGHNPLEDNVLVRGFWPYLIPIFK